MRFTLFTLTPGITITEFSSIFGAILAISATHDGLQISPERLLDQGDHNPDIESITVHSTI